MGKMIFPATKLEALWSFFQKAEEKKFNDDPKLLYYLITLDDLKSFQSAPNGMKWSASPFNSRKSLSVSSNTR